MKFLDNIKKKDSDQKESFALFVSVLITLFIFGVWSVSMFYGILGDDSKSDENIASPIEIFKKQADSIFSGKEVYNAEN